MIGVDKDQMSSIAERDAFLVSGAEMIQRFSISWHIAPAYENNIQFWQSGIIIPFS